MTSIDPIVRVILKRYKDHGYCDHCLKLISKKIYSCYDIPFEKAEQDIKDLSFENYNDKFHDILMWEP